MSVVQLETDAVPKNEPALNEAQKVIAYVLDGVKEPVHSTKLVKLVYLIDYLYFQNFGRTLTGFEYMWDHYGPNAVGHAIIQEAWSLASRGFLRSFQQATIYGTESTKFTLGSAQKLPPLKPEEEIVIKDTLARFGKMSLTEVIAASKRTEPFRAARQYGVLRFDFGGPVPRTTPEDLKAHRDELRQYGMYSLNELKTQLGLA